MHARDVFVFEVVSASRRLLLSGTIDERAAAGALTALRDLRIVLHPSLALSARAWDLRRNIATADALFVALAERLQAPLITKDAPLARAAGEHSAARVLLL